MAEARDDRFRRACALVEDCLREGFTPERIPGAGNKTAVAEAALRWVTKDGRKISYRAFWQIIEDAKALGITPDWSAYRPRQYLHRSPGAPVIPDQSHVQEEEPEGEPEVICVIGDAHDSPHIRDKSRFRWLGQFAAEHGVDRVVQVGDWWTMDCFSSHTDRATLEGLSKPTFDQDRESFHESANLFHLGMEGHKAKRDVTIGNHEDRAWKYDNLHPSGVSHGLMVEEAFAQWGFRTTPYGQYRFFGGVGFVHVPLNGLSKPLAQSQRVNKAMFDTVHGDDHRALQLTDHKSGPVRSPTLYSAGTALPPGLIERFANKGASTWRAGVCLATVWGGHVRRWSFEEMILLRRRYWRQGDGPKTFSGWNKAA
jgi:hypothetical protein